MIQRLRPRIQQVVDALCIGAALAYTEAEIAFTTLLQRTSSLKMLDAFPVWRSNLGFRGLTRLRLSLT